MTSRSRPTSDTERLFPRRFLIAGSGLAAAAGVTQAVAGPAAAAAAAPPRTAWQLGGNSNVTTDGTNFLGTNNVAPLIVKTKPSNTKPVTEQMRVQANGRVGIGTKTPGAQLDVASALAQCVRGTSTNATSSATGLQGVADEGAGVRGNSADNYGVFGTGGYCGLRGQGGSYGSIASGSSTGHYGSGADYGLYGSGGTYGGYGVGSSFGLYGAGQTGVRGSGTTYGVVGATTNPNSDAVRGDGGQYGCHGVNGRTAGARGDSGYVGVWGEATTYGVYGRATDGTGVSYGLFGLANNGVSYAMYAQGNARVTGTLQKGAGSFLIDHPLDPDNKWLSHSFVESPDMMNVYNGTAVLDAEGEATVELPDYFRALNRDFRYQLTAIGGAAPDLHVSREIRRNRFAIAGGSAGLKVSWQVTGIRQDAYAKAHPIVVETDKTGADRGTRQFVPTGSAARRPQLAPRSDDVPAPPPEPRVPAPTPRGL